MSIRTYVWKAADLSRAWDQLTDFAKDVATYINQQRVTADIANGAVTSDKLAPVPFLSLMRDAAFSTPTGGAVPTLVPMTLVESATGVEAPVFSATMGGAVVRRAGMYRVSASVHYSATVAPAGSTIEVVVFVDGVRQFIGSHASALNAGVTVWASKVIQLNAGQLVDVRSYQNTGAVQALATGSDRRPRLQIEYVGGL